MPAGVENESYPVSMTSFEVVVDDRRYGRRTNGGAL